MSQQKKQPQAGDVIEGKYRLERVLGRGGMGIVFQAQDIDLRRSVAIKFLLPGPSEARPSRDAVERFKREAQIGSSLVTEHVVRVEHMGKLEDGTPFLAMEMLRGQDLGDLLAERLKSQKRPLAIDEACDYLLDVCEALAEAHARGIIHRDLKPSNLFLARRANGQRCIKLLDFGISKPTAGIAAQGGKLTGTTAVLGSPLYMAPEQGMNPSGIDVRADLWSLGVTLYELISGRLPFDAETLTALLARIITEPPTPLRTHLPDAPPAIEATIERCLRKNPADRFLSVMGFAEELAPFCVRGSERIAAIRTLLQTVLEDLKEETSVMGVPAARPLELLRALDDMVANAATDAGATDAPAATPGASTHRSWSATHRPRPEVMPDGPRRPWLLAPVGAVALALVGVGWSMRPTTAPAATPAGSSAASTATASTAPPTAAPTAPPPSASISAAPSNKPPPERPLPPPPSSAGDAPKKTVTPVNTNPPLISTTR